MGKFNFTCFFLNSKIQDKKTNVEATVKLAKMSYGADDPRVELARTISTTCADVTDADRCEAAGKIHECATEKAKELGVEMKELL